MSKGLKINKALWVAIWVVAILQTLIGGIPPTVGWRLDVQYPGILVALVLQWLLGSIAQMFGANGEVFVAVATLLTNVLIYASLVSLVLVVRKALRSPSSQ